MAAAKGVDVEERQRLFALEELEAWNLALVVLAGIAYEHFIE